MGLDKSVPFEGSLILAFNAFLPTFQQDKEWKARAMATSITVQHHSCGTAHAAMTTVPLLPGHAPSLPPIAQSQPCPNSPASTSDSSTKGWIQVSPKGRIVKVSYATTAAATKTTQPHPTMPASQAQISVHPTPLLPTLSRIPSRTQLNKMPHVMIHPNLSLPSLASPRLHHLQQHQSLPQH